MNRFTHVKDDALRELLNAKSSEITKEQVYRLIAATEVAMTYDELNENVSYPILDVRIDFFEKALECYNKDNIKGAHRNIQSYWLV